jgi:DNA-binding beta-propeller fold protein YncE
VTGVLRRRATVTLPPGRAGAFDHGDVDPVTGRAFVAHTAFGSVDIVDPDRLESVGLIEGCPEGSGVLCVAQPRLVFIASRGAGTVLIVDPDRLVTIKEVAVGPKPNGLAWDGRRDQLLVADVDASDQAARLIRAGSAEVIVRTPLPGRPRWCVYDEVADRFLVNIRDPASVVSLSAASGELVGSWSISAAGPHGLDLDRAGRRGFVACDAARVMVIDLTSGEEVAAIPISGEPDAIWFNPARSRLYVGVGNPGLLDVIDTERGTVLESIPVEAGAKTSAIDIERQRLYVFMPLSCAAAVFEEH